jgi:hypothetical protein
MSGGFNVSQGGTQVEVPADTTLTINGTLNVQGAMQQDGVMMPVNITFSPAPGSANVCDVTVTLVDGNGAAIPAVHSFDLWLSDAATGAGITATAASGTVTNAAASGVVISTYTAKKALRVQTTPAGVFVLEITDTAKTPFFIAASLGGRAIVSAQLVTGNYG